MCVCVCVRERECVCACELSVLLTTPYQDSTEQAVGLNPAVCLNSLINSHKSFSLIVDQKTET